MKKHLLRSCKKNNSQNIFFVYLFFVFGILEFTFKDFIDIGLTTFLIYQLFTRLHEKHIILFFKVFGGFLLIYEVVNFFNLEALSFLLERVKEIAFIGIIVIFSQEFRKAFLTLLPRNRLAITSFDVETFAEELADALVELSNEQTGAFIMIEKEPEILTKEVSYQELVTRFNKEVLLQIFNKTSPFHDGAVLIRNGYIVAVRVITDKVSTDPDLPGSLGTRHRAALAISEVSDVLVFVVSEETGYISKALKGNLKRRLSRDIIIKSIKDFYKE